MMSKRKIDLAGMIDHTLLRADASARDIRKLCSEAGKYGFATVCINPYFVPLAKRLLKGTKVKVCTVVGFPLGCDLPAVKAAETKAAIRAGAQEIDMVLNIAAMKSRDYAGVKRDVAAVVNAAGKQRVVKVILETCYHSKADLRKAVDICIDAGADFVKTSTGFGTGGATLGDVRLMKERCTKSGRTVEVKASGGIRDRATALKMLRAGATRIGTSSGIAIVTGK